MVLKSYTTGKENYIDAELNVGGLLKALLVARYRGDDSSAHLFP